MTVSHSEWEELSEMKKVMKDLVERLAVFERAIQRGATSDWDFSYQEDPPSNYQR